MEMMVDEGEEEDEKERRVYKKWDGATQFTHVYIYKVLLFSSLLFLLLVMVIRVFEEVIKFFFW